VRETLVTRLQDGETVTFRPHGNSMTPHISSGQLVTVEPAEGGSVRVGDVVLARVCGVLRLHLVSATDKARKRVQISNARGHVNGWTSYSRVYGKCVRVEP
jgi:SOS-response transcriptional repressor LexA